jgi:hypothetical protein
MSKVLIVGLLACGFAVACDCLRTAIACSYRSADLVFRGRPEGAQSGPVRFRVGETFKGPAMISVLIQPGFYDCKTHYASGKEYLIFARKMLESPMESPLYVAGECSGSQPAGEAEVASQIAALRAYRNGSPVPHMEGLVSLYPYQPWAGVRWVRW